ncbi:hypothetical protein [Parasphingorhabdus pacifica]
MGEFLSALADRPLFEPTTRLHRKIAAAVLRKTREVIQATVAALGFGLWWGIGQPSITTGKPWAAEEGFGFVEIVLANCGQHRCGGRQGCHNGV